MNYREATNHARSGGTAFCGSREIRFLTFAEAEPILLKEKPELDNDGNEFASTTFDLRRLGLYDVSGAEPVEFRPTAEDIAGEWSTEAPPPEVVAPEVVDDILNEEIEEPQ